MTFLSITAQQHDSNIADALVMRERELYQYDLNIGNYSAMLQSLPDGEWPEQIAQFKGKPLDQVPDELDAEVETYNYRDKLKMLLRTETAERNKSFLVYQTLLAKMPTDQAELAAAVSAAVARLNV